MWLDIERLKKLNSLAGELKHQGIAIDHEDAAFLAVTMVGEEGEQCLADMHINENQSLVMREIIKDKHYPDTEVQKQVQGMSKVEAQAVLQEFATVIVQELNTLQQKFDQHNARLAKMIEEVTALQLQSLQTKQETVVQEHVPVQQTLQQPMQQAQSVAAQGASNPRTGTFAAEDVSIEKMFYFGSKKS